MAKRGILARLLGLPAGPPVPKTAKLAQAAQAAQAAKRAPPAGGGTKTPPMTANRKVLIQEAMRVHGKMRDELGEEEIEKMAKAIMGEKKP